MSSSATIARRRELLAPHTIWDNVVSCMEDADFCLEAAHKSSPFPGTDVADTRELWLEAAEKWINRAGQHAFGFALPREW